MAATLWPMQARSFLTSSSPRTARHIRAPQRKTRPVRLSKRRESSSTATPKQAHAYKQFVRPFAKVFLGAMFTYQVLYWAWEKLRLDEIRAQKLDEVKELEAKVEDLQKRKDGAVGRPVR